jgi:FMN phosphatase YigB (HAD superfamily)
MIEIYRKHIPKIKISDKNIKLLKLLKKKYLLCIITNGNP